MSNFDEEMSEEGNKKVKGIYIPTSKANITKPVNSSKPGLFDSIKMGLERHRTNKMRRYERKAEYLSKKNKYLTQKEKDLRLRESIRTRRHRISPMRKVEKIGKRLDFGMNKSQSVNDFFGYNNKCNAFNRRCCRTSLW